MTSIVQRTAFGRIEVPWFASPTPEAPFGIDSDPSAGFSSSAIGIAIKDGMIKGSEDEEVK